VEEKYAMALSDKDLLSIQEARQLALRAYDAQQIWAKASQAQVDRVCAAMAEAAYLAAERLGRIAAEETGYGVPEHKKLKNEFGSKHIWESIKDIKTVGVINYDAENKVYEIAWPMGVVAALIPSTNPTSTVMNKILISVKARDAIVVAPHPAAVNCCLETARLMATAAESAGAPKGLVNCLTLISLPGTQELMASSWRPAEARWCASLIRWANQPTVLARGTSRFMWIVVPIWSGPPSILWPAKPLITLSSAPQNRRWWLIVRSPTG